MLVGFFAKGLALDFELEDAALDLVDIAGERVDFHAQAGGSFVN